MKRTIQVSYCDEADCKAEAEYNCQACGKDICVDHDNEASRRFTLGHYFSVTVDISLCDTCHAASMWGSVLESVMEQLIRARVIGHLTNHQGEPLEGIPGESRKEELVTQYAWLTRTHLYNALLGLGLTSANRGQDMARWTMTDLITDLLPLLNVHVCAMPAVSNPLVTQDNWLNHAQLDEMFKKLGVYSIGATTARRWSRTDLVTDLLPLLLEHRQASGVMPAFIDGLPTTKLHPLDYKKQQLRDAYDILKSIRAPETDKLGCSESDVMLVQDDLATLLKKIDGIVPRVVQYQCHECGYAWNEFRPTACDGICRMCGLCDVSPMKCDLLGPETEPSPKRQELGRSKYIQALGEAYRLVTGYHQAFYNKWGVANNRVQNVAEALADLLEHMDPDEPELADKFCTIADRDPDVYVH